MNVGARKTKSIARIAINKIRLYNTRSKVADSLSSKNS